MKRKAKASSASSPSVALDLDAVRELARIAEEFDLVEVEADPSGHVRVRRAGVAAAEAPRAASAVTSIGLAPSLTSSALEAGGAAEAGTFVSSPFVGTFYRAPSPDAEPFAEVGQEVRKGQVVCIVEAMKLMNEIEAETDGKVLEILVKNGEHVEYGQHLVRLSRS
jgi:acetyl-CoA carboxylase biotin carboxyl carrier protein